MDKEKLKAYGVDYENAVKRFAGNEALYEKFLKKLTEDRSRLKRGCRNPWNDGTVPGSIRGSSFHT